MKLCFIADANSIHTRRWVEYFCDNPENEVHILSPMYSSKPVKGALLHNLSGLGKGSTPINGTSTDGLPPQLSKPFSTRRVERFVTRRVQASELLYTAYFFYSAFRFGKKAKAIVQELQPDLVHCLRVNSEGYIGGLIGYHPLIVSTWGNDLIYWAQRHSLCRWLTKKTLSRTDLLFVDSIRDKYIAEVYGFHPSKLSCVMPVTGGLKLEQFPLYRKGKPARGKLQIDSSTNSIISIRGFKSLHINTEALIKAIPKVVRAFPNSFFIIAGAYGTPEHSYLKRLAQGMEVERYIRFINWLSQEELVDYLGASDIMVSVTNCDGCPVSMLEGMAYGVIPIMSNHSSIQEWVTDGWNGYLFDPTSPPQIADAIIRALKNKANFPLMRRRNWDILKQRADYYKNMKIVEQIYHQLVAGSRKAGGEG